MPPGHPEHLRSFDYLGLHRYSLRFCTAYRTRHFTDVARVSLVLDQIVRAAREERFAIVAYCFMPDHVHLLVEGLADGSHCLSFIRRAKQYTGYDFNKTYHTPLWQRYGFERVLRSDDDLLTVARYILENPVRGGLVTRVQDYLSCGSLTHPTDQILDAVQMMPRTRYSSV